LSSEGIACVVGELRNAKENFMEKLLGNWSNGKP
jgi:hypothetical protein